MSLLSTISNTESINSFSEKLCYCCHELSSSVENLRGSIDRYEDFKKTKKPRTIVVDKLNGRE